MLGYQPTGWLSTSVGWLPAYLPRREKRKGGNAFSAIPLGGFVAFPYNIVAFGALHYLFIVIGLCICLHLFAFI